MNAPKRIRAFLNDEASPSWWLTFDGGRSFERASGARERVALGVLSLVGDGLNDPDIAALFSRQQKVVFQKPREHG